MQYKIKKNKLIGGAIVLLLLISSGCYTGLLCFLENHAHRSPENRLPTPEPVIRLTVGNGTTIAAWYTPAASPENYTFLYSYGTLEQLAWKTEFLAEFVRRGYGIMGYDYEGFGSSAGTPSLSATLRDGEAAYRYLTEEAKVPPEKIITVGFSMGSAPSAYIASKYPVAGTVLISGFASILQVGVPGEHWPGDKLKVCEYLAARPVPVLLIHGTADAVVPYRNAELNYSRAAGRKRLVSLPDTDHHHDYIFGAMSHDRFFTLLQEFFPTADKKE